MGSEAMITFLAAAAKKAREDAERKIIHIAVVADVDPSTIWRFEQGRWPRDTDEIISAYADELELDPQQLWARALELWINADGPSGEDAADAVRHVRDAAREQSRSQKRSPEKPRAKPGRAA